VAARDLFPGLGMPAYIGAEVRDRFPCLETVAILRTLEDFLAFRRDVEKVRR